MRSLRDMLISKREEKGLTTSQVAYETNISKKYIEALEEENFTEFPAEAYLLGFLRNYAEFLGLSYDAVLAEYKNCLLRDEPTPLSELMGVKPSFEFKLWMVILPLVALGLFFGIPPVVKAVGNQIEIRKEALRLAGENKTKNYIINDQYTDQKVKVNDTFSLNEGEDKVTYIVQEIESDLILSESYLDKERVITLKLGSEVESEIVIKDKKYIVTLYLKDIGGFSDNSAILKIKSEARDFATFDSESNSDDLGLFSNDTAKDAKIIMVKKHSPDPYSISIKFEGDILFRYQQKGEELIENIYQKNSVLNLDITRSIMIWTSNAGLTKFKINGEVMVLGRTGEVHVFQLRWIYINDKDEYRLEYSTAY